MNHKKILIISYLFPPIGGGGVVRIAKFAKYLPSLGWQVSVLTVKKWFYPIEDRSLLAELPKAVNISRVNYFEPALWFTPTPKLFGVGVWQAFLAYLVYPLILIPDRQILWFLPAVVTGWKIIKKEKIKIIFTTSAPTSDHLIGLILKRITGVKWVADFRDEWANNPFKKYPTPIHRLVDRFLEKLVIKNADQVIAVSRPIVNYLQNLSEDKEKFLTITNGFDESDFKNLVSSKSKIFRLVYVGSLYNAKYREGFVQAFRSLNLKNARLIFVGEKNKLPHYEAVKKMVEAEVLLLILDPVKRPGVLTGKLFEYMRGRKPILAIAGKETEVAKMIIKYHLGEVVEPNLEAFQGAVRKMYQKWLKNDLKIPQVNLAKYERKYLTIKLTKNFEIFTNKKKYLKLCLIGNIQSPQNINLCHYILKKGYNVHFISVKPGKITNVKTYYLGKNFSTPWYFLKSIYKIRKLIWKIQPDIVHGQDLVFGGMWAYLSGFRPFVVTPWGTDIMNYRQFIKIEKYLIKKSLQKADLVTVSSNELQKQAEKIGLANNLAQMIHFGIDLNNFKNMPKSNNLIRKYKLQRRKIIFCPRSIAPIYNTDILIHAFVQVARKDTHARLALLDNIADENFLLEVEKLIIHYNLVNKVIFLPKVDNREMIDYYNLADAVVTISSSDGCSVSFLEAMASEKKIVVTNLPYIKEWQDQNNLWTVPIRDVAATGKAIELALKMPTSKWKKIGKFNRKMIAQRAEINHNFEKLDQLYRSLI